MKVFIRQSLLLVCLFLIKENASAATLKWVGTTSNWNTATNWSPAAVPTITDDVQIGVATFTTQPTIASGQTAYAASITIGSAKTTTLTISGTLNVAGDITMASTSTVTMDATTACKLYMGGDFSGGTFNPSIFSGSAITFNGTSAQYFPNDTKLGGHIGFLDITNTYYGSDTDRGVKLNNLASTSVIIDYLHVEPSAIFNANATLVEGTGYHATIDANATYISRSTFNFHSNDVVDATATLEFTASSQVINLYKPNAGGTNVGPNVKFTGSNITVNAGTSPNNATTFLVRGNLTVQNTTSSVTFDSRLTLIDINGDFTGTGALSSGALPINIAGSWLNTGTFNTSGIITYDGNDATKTQIVSPAVIYQKDIVFTGASPKTVSSGTLTVAGNVDNSAGSVVDFTTNSTTLLMNGSGTQYIKGGTSLNTTFPNNLVAGMMLNNLTVATTGSSPNVTLQGNNNIGPQGVISFTSASSVLDATSSNSLTLLSDASGSANVATLPSGNSIKGSVNVQRYLTGGNTKSGGVYTSRGYRLISSPVNISSSITGTGNISLNYINTNSTVSGVTTLAATTGGLSGTTNGFTVSSANPTVYLYKETLPVSNVTYTSGKHMAVTTLNSNGTVSLLSNGVTTTNVTIPVGNGYIFYFVGNTNNPTTKTVNPTSGPENTTITAKGYLNQGTISLNLWFTPTGGANKLSYTSGLGATNAGFNMVGNPYASTLDLNQLINDNSASIATTVYELNNVSPNQSYIAYSQGGSSDPRASQYVVSGQGFIVKAKSTTSTLTFKESEKVTTNPLTPSTAIPLLMGKPKEDAPITGLYMKMEMDSMIYDYCGIYFSNNWSDKFDDNDALDLDGASSRVYMSSFTADGVRTAINRLPDYKSGSRIKLYASSKTDGTYNLKLEGVRNIDPLYNILLVDHYKKDSLDMRQHGSYSFQISSSDSSTSGNSRFELVIRRKILPTYKLNAFKAEKIESGVKISWNTLNEGNYTTFKVQRASGNNSTEFETLNIQRSDDGGSYYFIDHKPYVGKNIYQLEQNDIDNNLSFSNAVNVTYSLSSILNNVINVYPNPAKEMINVDLTVNDNASNESLKATIFNTLGLVMMQKNVSTTNWSHDVAQLSPGSYLIEIRNNNGSLIGRSKFTKVK